MFAIGLRPLFSFRRKLPPVLRTTSKVRDSQIPCRTKYTYHVNGVLTLCDAFFQKDLRGGYFWQKLSRLQFKNTVLDLQFELFPVQSPLLRESFSFSFPPLTYMLKFSGCPYLRSCVNKSYYMVPTLPLHTSAEENFRLARMHRFGPSFFDAPPGEASLAHTNA